MTYAEKLRDPRWQKKRLLIMQRDGFQCQRCGSVDTTLNVHHANGYRAKTDPWDYPDPELVTLCEKCHTAEHAAPLLGVRFYLAGKIDKNGWRGKVVDFPGDVQCRGPATDGDEEQDHLVVERCINSRHHYCGPWFISCDHGCSHGDNSHGLGHGCIDAQFAGQRRAFWNCTIQIQRCQVFFAWLESEDCFGTLAEIGFAAALRKPIWIGLAKPLNNLWFAQLFAGGNIREFKEPGEAFKWCVEEVEQLIEHRLLP